MVYAQGSQVSTVVYDLFWWCLKQNGKHAQNMLWRETSKGNMLVIEEILKVFLFRMFAGC